MRRPCLERQSLALGMGKFSDLGRLAVAKESPRRYFFDLTQQDPAFGGRESRVLAGSGSQAHRPLDNIIRRRGQRRAHALRSSNGLDHPLISYSIVSLVNPYPSFYPTARLLSHTSHHARMRPQLIYRTSKHPLLTASWLGIPLSLPR